MKQTLHDICREKISQRFGKGEPALWTDSSFKQLSLEIGKDASLLISHSTLKRYFGRVQMPEAYDPQRETKNAFALYIGYQNWEDFERENKGFLSPEVSIEPGISKPKLNRIYIGHS